MPWYDPQGRWGVKDQWSAGYINGYPDLIHKVNGFNVNLLMVKICQKQTHTSELFSCADPLSRQVKSTKRFIRKQTQNKTLIHKHWACSFKALAPSVLSWSEKACWARTCWRTYDTLSTFTHFGAMSHCVHAHFVQICMHICTFWRHPWTCASRTLCRTVHLHFVEIWEWALYIDLHFVKYECTLYTVHIH